MTAVMKIAPNIPLAEKSATVLRKFIQANYPDGGRIPGEHELSELLGVNRGTLRQALKTLEQEGLIIRRQGSGTYANKHVLGIRMRLEAIVRFTELVAGAGYEPRRVQLSWGYHTAGEDAVHQLDLEVGDEVLISRLLILADEEPAVYVRSAVPVKHVRNRETAIQQPEPLFDFLPNNCGVQIAYGITEIVPHICGAELAELLQMDPQAAILQLNDTYFTEDNIPVMASWISVKDPIVRFRAIRRQLSAS